MGTDFTLSAPLILISSLAIIGTVLDALIKNSARITFLFGIFGLGATAVAAALTLNADGTAFNGMVKTGGYAAFFDILFCISGILTMLASRPYLERENFEHDEFYSLIMYAVGGMALIAHANHLLVLFIGIEVMSISFYVLAGYFRNTIRSVEASLKYFLLGSFSTGFMLYGMALIYGATGSFFFPGIREAATAGVEFPSLMIIGVGLLIIGLSFKIAAFPFHQWVPDVYQGAPTVVTAFMSTAGKAAALSALIPVIIAVMPVNPGKIQWILAMIAAGTMLVGNISAVVQTNVKRMLAYSSVAHAGYIIMGLVANNEPGWSGMMFYATAYIFMQLGAFVIVSILEEHGEHLELDDYAGLSKRHPMLAGLMALFMFSLAGIPPFAGFFGKYILFKAAIDSGFTWLTIVAVVSSMISVYFYIGLVVNMYFKDSEDTESTAPVGAAGISLIASAFFVVFLGVLPNLLNTLTNFFFRK